MSEIRFRLAPKEVCGFAIDKDTTLDDLRDIGIDATDKALDALETLGAAEFGKSAMDAAPATITTPSAAYALQFLQHFYAEPIVAVTQARVADRVFGRTFAGAWEDEEIVLPIAERVGQGRPYTDAGNIPLSTFNVNYEARTVFRAELGLRNGELEQRRAAKQRIDAMGLKRSAVTEALAIIANDIAFNGFNGGNGRTYGGLNDPGLPAYTTVAATGTGSTTTWSTKSFANITADLRGAVQALRTRSGYNFAPERDAFTIAVAGACAEYLNTATDYNMSVMDYIKKTWPGARVEAVPQFNTANGGANVFYVIADRINGRPVVEQVMQQALFLVGITPEAKGNTEDYSNATAGVLVGQPIGIVRYSGI